VANNDEKTMEDIVLLQDSAVKLVKRGALIIESGFLDRRTPLPPPGVWVRLADGRGAQVACGFIDRARDGDICRVVGSELGLKSKPKDSYFTDKIMTAFEKRREQFQGSSTDVYRLLNAEGDGVPGIILDRYGDFGVAWTISPGVKAISRPVYEAAFRIFRLKGLYEKGPPAMGKDHCGSESDRPVLGEDAPAEIVVTENEMLLNACIVEGPKTGVYHDQKENRELLKPLFKDISLLNTFSYTGAFSVSAALAGAKDTVSVDLSKRALQRSKANFVLNKVDLAPHRHVKADVFDYLKLAIKKGFFYDGIILDPVTFSTSSKGIFRAGRDWPRLIAGAMSILNKGGWIALSCNTRTLSEKNIRRFINKAAREEDRKVKVKAVRGLPADFPVHPQLPTMDYLKFVLIRCS